MKKRQIIEGTIIRRDFPNKSIAGDIEVIHEDGTREAQPDVTCVIKNALPGQRVRGVVNKVRHGNAEARLTAVVQEAPGSVASPCPYFGICGSCHYLSMTYEAEQQLKEQQMLDLLKPAFARQDTEPVWDGIKESPVRYEYRNKMEFSFGDEVKDGPLTMGMHKRGSMHDIISTRECRIIDEDYRKILSCVLDYWTPMYVPLTGNENTDTIDSNTSGNTTDELSSDGNPIANHTEKVTFYHTMKQKGYLRHLLVRKARKTGQILVDLVTTSQEDHDLTPLKDKLLALDLDGEITGFLHTTNDSLSDAVIDQGTEVIYGKSSFEEELLGLKFEITPFSFFQTNSLSAEVLYSVVRDYVREGMKEQCRDKAHTIYDLYCGTGTISQLMSPVADEVIGVEIVEEAVEAAKVNAERNGVHNCRFIADDVLKALDNIAEKPDYIILDPPRDGIHPKALQKIIAYGVQHIVYVSCKPTSLARDLEAFQAAGYRVERACAVNQFPLTQHVEVVMLLCRRPSQ